MHRVSFNLPQSPRAVITIRWVILVIPFQKSPELWVPICSCQLSSQYHHRHLKLTGLKPLLFTTHLHSLSLFWLTPPYHRARHLENPTCSISLLIPFNPFSDFTYFIHLSDCQPTAIMAVIPQVPLQLYQPLFLTPHQVPLSLASLESPWHI